jgi:hypothetical protein
VTARRRRMMSVIGEKGRHSKPFSISFGSNFLRDVRDLRLI